MRRADKTILVEGARQNTLKNVTVRLPIGELTVLTGVSGSGKSSFAFDQTNPVRTSRSTVGTMTELADHLKLLYARAARLFCGGCGREVRRDSPETITDAVIGASDPWSLRGPAAAHPRPLASLRGGGPRFAPPLRCFS